MRLSDRDKATLGGELGEGARIALELVVASGEAMGAEDLLDISGAHIDGCLYHGIAGLDFARRLAESGGEVVVPTTLNVSSLDLLHPDLYRGDEETAQRAGQLMDAYQQMGCRPTWTCAPYQLTDRPGYGDQVAWGESNAIVFANSVLGARTNRYGDFLDICCALTGRAPAVDLHTDAGRRATMALDVSVPDPWLDEDLLYVGLGLILGREAGSKVATLTGLDERADEDRLKALGAAAASSGAVAMFHVVGVTPESETLGSYSGDRRILVDSETIADALRELSGDSRQGLGAVRVGTPHASGAELLALAGLVEGRTSAVPFYVNASRDVLTEVPSAVATIEAFGATVVADTCTYITPIIGDVDGVVMTNSGKWAYYAPGNLGVEVSIGSMTDCVESAVRGEVVVSGLLS
ncbi:MAG TPA: aconitase X catalytic domain-containing protein [Acidimicrobiia bacterium]|nr:aconitase X catalytic domain-containing protein [Acidimicrobiia bacterium]